MTVGVVHTLEADLDWLEERIDFRGTFTDTVHREWQLPQVDVCLLCPLREVIAYVCLIYRGEMVVTFKRRVRFVDLVSLGVLVQFEDLGAEMPTRLYRHLESKRWAGGSVPPKTWQATLNALKKLRPQTISEIERL